MPAKNRVVNVEPRGSRNWEGLALRANPNFWMKHLTGCLFFENSGAEICDLASRKREATYNTAFTSILSHAPFNLFPSRELFVYSLPRKPKPLLSDANRARSSQ